MLPSTFVEEGLDAAKIADRIIESIDYSRIDCGKIDYGEKVARVIRGRGLIRGRRWLERLWRRCL